MGLQEVDMVDGSGVWARNEVFRSLIERGTCFLSFMMKGDACAKVCRIWRQKISFGKRAWKGAPPIFFYFLFVGCRTVNLRIALRANLVVPGYPLLNRIT